MSKKKHPSDSFVQRDAEGLIRSALAKKLKVDLSAPQPFPNLKLDGFADEKVPVCVEIWAHQGWAKGGQKHKVMSDMCKLLVFERKLNKRCKKIFAVSDMDAVAFLEGSWMSRFAAEFDIDVRWVYIPPSERTRIRTAQKRQRR
jgi:hypothetical protein